MNRIRQAYNKTDKSLTYNHYSQIINKFNELLSKAIIEEGYRFKIPNIGTLSISKIRRNFSRLSIDFGESNKRKQELIKEGKTPYESIRNENGEIIGNNGGVNWLVYKTDSIYLKFYIGNNRKVSIGDHNYWFTPTWHNRRNLAKRYKETGNDLIYEKN